MSNTTITWEEAKVIRSTYPRRLTNAHIQEIMDKWGNIIVDRADMFQFSCTPRKDGKMNMTELKLWFIFNNNQHKLEIIEFNTQENNIHLQKMHGSLMAAWLSHIIDEGEYETSTQNLRKRTIKQLLDIWKKNSSYFREQVKGVQQWIDIKATVHEICFNNIPIIKKYDNPISFEAKCWKMIQKFIKQ